MKTVKNLIIKSGIETITIEPLNTFRCVEFSIKDTNLNEWNNITFDTQNLEDVIKFFTLQLKRSKQKTYKYKWNKQRTNHV